jgi:hypothetical protein
MANLEAVVKELRQERDKLDKAITTLTSLDGTRSHKPLRRAMSAATRRRIAAAQRARWAKERGAEQSAPAVGGPKRHISPAGIARIRAAAKARWAKARAAKKK